MIINNYNCRIGKDVLKIDLKFLMLIDCDLFFENGLLPNELQEFDDILNNTQLDLLVMVRDKIIHSERILKINDSGFNDYLINNEDTGIYVLCNENQKILNDLITDKSFISNIEKKVKSNYVTKNIKIDDITKLNELKGKNFEIIFKINNVQYKTLIIKSMEVYNEDVRNVINIKSYNNNYGFELEKVIDNRKSWSVDKYDKILLSEFNTYTIEKPNKIKFILHNGETKTMFTPNSFINEEIIATNFSDNLLTVQTNKKEYVYDVTNYFTEKYEVQHNNILLGNKDNDGSEIELRKTNYKVDDDRLILNTKETTLRVNGIKLFNDKILKSIFLDFKNIIPSQYSLLLDSEKIETISDLENYIINSLCNVHTIKTQKFNEFIIKLLEIYLNRLIENPKLNGEYIYNENINNEYVIALLNKINNNWFSILENVLPSTIIWDDIKIMGDTYLSNNKYNYRKSTTYFNDTFINEDDVIKNINLDEVIITDNSFIVNVTDKKIKNVSVQITELNHNSMFSGYWIQENKEI